MRLFSISLLVITGLYQPVLAGTGKLLATAGLTQAEGSGGGGIVPWATLAGYDSNTEVSVVATITQLSLADYRLNTVAVSASIYDKLEVSLARQTFDLKTLGGNIRQNIVGIKYKIYGDAVYTRLPQISAGLQYKSLSDKAIAQALGAKGTSGIDYYIAATKIHLAAVAGYNAVWNATLRATKANEMGLLGFGSTQSDNYSVMFEASAGLLLSQHIVVGMEYRQKPDNLSLGEDDWVDYFISYIPSKSFSLTAAWAELGTIAGAPKQRGLYLSLSGQLF